MKRLNYRQNQFAEKHHDLVIQYLTDHGLSEEWYDTVIFGFIEAVTDFDSISGIGFQELAYRYMDRYYTHEAQKKPDLEILSLEEPVWGGVTMEELLVVSEDSNSSVNKGVYIPERIEYINDREELCNELLV